MHEDDRKMLCREEGEVHVWEYRSKLKDLKLKKKKDSTKSIGLNDLEIMDDPWKNSAGK